MTAQNLRRSGRSNKGLHRPRIFEDPLIPIDEQVRCICETIDDENGVMVQCEKCTTWQHILCMGYQDEKSLPETYFCEECRPDLYPQLQKISQRTTKSKSKNSIKKTVKKSNTVPKTSSVKIDSCCLKDIPNKELPKELLKEPIVDDLDKIVYDTDKNSVRNTSSVPELSSEDENSDFDHKTPSPVSTSDSDYHSNGNRREPPTKMSRISHEHSYIKALYNHKQPTMSKHLKQVNPPLSKQPISHLSIEGPVQRLEELKDVTRKHVSQSFFNIFVTTIKNFIENGSLVLGENETPENVGERLALSIEYIMFKDFSIEEKGKYILTSKYKERFRTLHFNLKDDKNPQLRTRVIFGEIVPKDLVHMTSEEMANSEIQSLAESVRAQSTKNSVLKQTDAPRIRRTHKGEEIIENQEINGLSVQQKAETSTSFYTKSQTDSEKIQKELPSTSQQSDSVHEKTSAIPKTYDSYSEKNKIHDDKMNTLSNESFNIQNVWSNIESQRTIHLSSENYPIIPVQETTGIEFDPDIDRMIDDDNDSTNTPPYSPSYNTYETTTIQPIWSGKVFMASVAEFSATATHVAGPSIPPTRAWSEILQEKIIIDGRISVDKSTEYLCHQKFSSTKQLIVVSFKPQSKEMSSSFDKLYHYFYSRKRYGVLKPTTPAVKDAYLIPLSPTDQLPEFIQLMDKVHISEEKRMEKYILGVFIVNKMTNTVPSVSNKIPCAPQGTNEWKEHNTIPLMHQGTNISTPLIPSLPVPPILGGMSLPNNLSLSSADMAILQSVLNANPSILSNPKLASNSKILQQLIIQHQNQQNQINASYSSNAQSMASRWDKK